MSCALPAPFPLCSSSPLPVCTFYLFLTHREVRASWAAAGIECGGIQSAPSARPTVHVGPQTATQLQFKLLNTWCFLAPLSPIHFLFKSKFPFQAKNIRSRKTVEQQTKLQICLLLLHPNFARLFLPMEGHQSCRTEEIGKLLWVSRG